MDSMFRNCESLISLNLSNFDTSKVTKMNSMFNVCKNLFFLDISNFNTSSVTVMDSMFSECINLTSLDLSHFNTSSVTLMFYMFNKCEKLTILNISNFNTSATINMRHMFSECSSLVSLDLLNFDTSSVSKMNGTFYKCSSLSSLNLSNFNTSKATLMDYMFFGCSNLISLDLSNFDTTNVIDIENMFSGCQNLQYLNIRTDFSNNINPIKTDSESENNEKCFLVNDRPEQIKFNYTHISTCFHSCKNSSIYTFKYNGKCYDICSNETCHEKGKIINISTIESKYGKCFLNILKNQNECLNLLIYIINNQCYKLKEEYYLELGSQGFQYKNCHKYCKKCHEEGNDTNHNCIECKPVYQIDSSYNSYFNCKKIVQIIFIILKKMN